MSHQQHPGEEEADARLLIGASEADANIYYATRFFAPDPFVYVEVAGATYVMVSNLELDRAAPVGAVHTGVVLVVDQGVDERSELMPETLGREERLANLVGIKKRGLFRASIEHNSLHAPSITQYYNKIFKWLQEKQPLK